MPAARPHPVLDRWPARGLAILIFLLAAASLAWLHREDLFGGDRAAADDPLARCIAARSDDVERMLRDGTISADQAAIFRGRLEGVCRAQVTAR